MVPNDIRLPHRASHGAKWLACRTRLIRKLAPCAFTPYSGELGAFAVKFRWVVIAAWLIAAIAAPKFVPSLSSVTQGNNSAFLPASAPSEQAAQLAAPFGSTNLIPVPVVAAVSQGTLTAADVTWLTGLQHDLGTVKTVVAVRDLGRSADQQAEQLQVLSNRGGGCGQDPERHRVRGGR
jgi:uncharacterized membrane protein YdfJ with MMPL/SSD domain